MNGEYLLIHIRHHTNGATQNKEIASFASKRLVIAARDALNQSNEPGYYDWVRRSDWVAGTRLGLTSYGA